MSKVSIFCPVCQVPLTNKYQLALGKDISKCKNCENEKKKVMDLQEKLLEGGFLRMGGVIPSQTEYEMFLSVLPISKKSYMNESPVLQDWYKAFESRLYRNVDMPCQMPGCPNKLQCIALLRDQQPKLCCSCFSSKKRGHQTSAVHPSAKSSHF